MRTCSICQKEVTSNGFLGHIAGKHKLNAAKYAEQFPGEAPIHKAVSSKAKLDTSIFLDGDDGDGLEAEILDTMTFEERKWYKLKVEEIFMQIDRDLTLKPRVRSLVSDLILSIRYNKELLRSNSKSKSDGKSSIDKDLNQAIKELESRIDTKMKSLGIDRQSKISSRSQSRSTASSLISAYIDEIHRQPVEVLETMEIEEKRALEEVQVILKKYYFPSASDIEPTHLLGTDNESGKSTYTPPSIEDVLQRAGIEL